MNRPVRTTLRLFVSVMLLSAVALAHATGNNFDKNTNRGHHSRLSKLAFWRGHGDHGRTGSHAAKMHHSTNGEHRGRFSKLAFWRRHKDNDTSAKTVQANHAALKSAEMKTSPARPAPRTSARKNGQKQAPHTARKSPAKTTPAATKAKPKQTAEGRTTASLHP
jgi:hypothetical protein